MSEQNNKIAIKPKCEGCANRIKITHFAEGGKETYSYGCVLLPLLPIINIEGIGPMVNVKDCAAFEPVQPADHYFGLSQLIEHCILQGNNLMVRRAAAELYLMDILKKHFPEAINVQILDYDQLQNK